jgi:hypothetical protein
MIWLSPSLAAGAIAARLVVFFKRRPQGSPRRGVKPYGPLLPRRVSNSNASPTTPWFVQQGRGDAERPITAAWRARPYSCPGGLRGGGIRNSSRPRPRHPSFEQ